MKQSEEFASFCPTITIVGIDMEDGLLLWRLQTARKIHNFAWQFEIKAGTVKRMPLIEDKINLFINPKTN